MLSLFIVEEGVWNRLRGWVSVMSVIVVLVALFTIETARAQERKNFLIPDDLAAQLKVKVAYNDNEVFFRFEWPSEPTGYYHDYLHFE